jgi:hypothetical protein
MERPREHEEDGSMKVVAEFDSALNNGRKSLSEVWEEFQPISLNGKVAFAVCLSCHNRFCYSGDSYLRRHLKTCPAKSEAAERPLPQEDSYLPNGICSLLPVQVLIHYYYLASSCLTVSGQLK